MCFTCTKCRSESQDLLWRAKGSSSFGEEESLWSPKRGEKGREGPGSTFSRLLGQVAERHWRFPRAFSGLASSRSILLSLLHHPHLTSHPTREKPQVSPPKSALLLFRILADEQRCRIRSDPQTNDVGPLQYSPSDGADLGAPLGCRGSTRAAVGSSLRERSDGASPLGASSLHPQGQSSSLSSLLTAPLTTWKRIRNA